MGIVGSSRPLGQLALAVVAVMLVTFLVKLYRARRFFRYLKSQGLPMPPHHPIFGHIPLCLRVLGKLPRDVHGNYLADQIRQRYPDLGPIYYVDAWPLGPPMLVVISPTLVSQFTQDISLPKHEGIRRFLRPLTGEHDLVSMEGQLWKTWRNIFNPGFSLSHLMTLVPEIMDEVLTFREILVEHAQKGDVFSMDEATISLTINVIARVVLDAKLNVQRGSHDFADAMRHQIRWSDFGAGKKILYRFNPFRPLVNWYNTRRMNRYVVPELEKRYATRKDVANSKTVIDLALKAYLAANASTDKGMDRTFKEFATSQMKLFIFAGHDTTASTISYVYYMLSKHPAALQRVRAEHDDVLSQDLSLAASLIAEKPHLLNQLPYTLAVIRETLRLFPVVSAPRAGQPDFSIVDSDGRQYPTEHCIVWCNHHGLHRNPAFWPRAKEFVPERWLVSADDPLYPIKNAWRPFEFGPRNCIGQELALIEIKMIMALTLRDLEVCDAYDEWDRTHCGGGGLWSLSGKPAPIKTVDGERAYQVDIGSAHPNDGLPCRVSFSSRT